MKRILSFILFILISSYVYSATQFQALNTSNATNKNLTVTYGLTVATVTITADASIGTDLTVTGNDITFGNAETISNTTDGSIKFTDGTNTLATIVDDGTAGSLNLGNTARKISDDGTNFELDLSTNVNMNANVILNIGNAGTDFSSAGALTTAAGITATTGKITATAGAVLLYSRSMAQLRAITPAVGDLYFDSTNYAVVVGTGTGVGAFGHIGGGAAAPATPTGW